MSPGPNLSLTCRGLVALDSPSEEGSDDLCPGYPPGGPKDGLEGNPPQRVLPHQALGALSRTCSGCAPEPRT